MKIKNKKVLILSIIMIIILIYFINIFLSQNIAWHDKQGAQIISIISNKNIIPVNIISKKQIVYHKGWSYFKLREWKWEYGSHITVHGVNDLNTQNVIINEIEKILKENDFNDIQLTFLNHSKKLREIVINK